MNEKDDMHSAEIEKLKLEITEVRRNMVFDDDLLDDLDDFNKKVSSLCAH